MKKYILTAIISLTLNNIYPQDKDFFSEITYKATLNTNLYESLKNAPDAVKKEIMKVIRNSKDVFYVLKINNNESFFCKKEKLNNDFEKGINMTETLSGEGIYYSNTNEILNEKESFGQKFLISYPKIKWVLTQQKKKIGKYVCYKATANKQVENKSGVINKKITAWYTLDIPHKFGPKEFSNLPGLILELQEDKLTFIVDKIKLNLSKKNKIIKPTKGKKLSLKKYNETIKKIVLDYRKN